MLTPQRRSYWTCVRDYTTSLGPVHRDWEALSAGVMRCRLAFLDVTVGLVWGTSGVLLIDCGTTISEAREIAEDVGDLTGRAPTDLVLTHHHFDHILGSAGLPGARILTSEAVQRALIARDFGEEAMAYGAAPAEVEQALAALRPADRVAGRAVIDLGDRAVSVEHPGRGHTDHDLVVVVPGDPVVVFCGDLVEQSADPAVGADSDLARWPHTLDRLLSLGGEDALYVPGHGDVVDAEFVRRQRDWLTSRCATPARVTPGKSPPNPG